MHYLALESGQLLCIDLVTNVEFVETGQHANKAKCWNAGVLVSAESKIAFEYFWPIYQAAQKQQDEAREKIQAGQGA